MYDFREELIKLARRAKEIHSQEKGLVVESAKILAYLERRNASVNLGLTKEGFAEGLGVSIDVYWKRVQAGRIILRFPRVEEMLEKGELHFSHVNLIAPKITEANEDILLERVRGRTKREIQHAVAITNFDGSTSPKEAEYEVRLLLKEREMQLLDRAIEVLSNSGKNANAVDAVVAGLEQLLEKKDPMRKAERAQRREEQRAQKNDAAAPTKKEESSPDPDQGFGKTPKSPNVAATAPRPPYPCLPKTSDLPQRQRSMHLC